MSAFDTQDRPFAAFLACTRKLDFLGCQRSDRGRASFLFDDPEEKGSRLYPEFQNGGIAPVVAVFAALKILRQAMDGAERKQEWMS